MRYMHMESPVGQLLIAGDDEGLRYLSFPKGRKPVVPESDWIKDDHFFKDIEIQLREYFKGQRQAFDIKLAPETTPFQKKVLKALQDIPYGQTRSYGDIAKKVGNPKASRAVGMANGRNPISIVIPCHRVIGTDGSLTGFGGGIPTKKKLLALEAQG